MARIRTIKPEFPHSESMGRVSRDARLLFVLLWTICDDSGRTRGASRMLASLLFPYDDDAPRLLPGWLAELEREGCLWFYDHDGSRYLQVAKWLNHQRIDKPSGAKCPEPREDSRALARIREHSGEDRDRDHDQDHDLEKDRGPGGELEGNRAAPQPEPQPKQARKTRAKTMPEDWSPNDTHARLAKEQGVNLDAERSRFVDFHVAKGSIFADWDAAFRTWIRNARQFGTRPTVNETPGRGRRNSDDPRLGAPSPAAKTIWSTPESVLRAKGVIGDF